VAGSACSSTAHSHTSGAITCAGACWLLLPWPLWILLFILLLRLLLLANSVSSSSNVTTSARPCQFVASFCIILMLLLLPGA
jgi:hypothetical protein